MDFVDAGDAGGSEIGRVAKYQRSTRKPGFCTSNSVWLKLGGLTRHGELPEERGTR